MLIIREENSYLKGTTHQLPPEILNIFKNIVNKYSQYAVNGGYKKAKNVVESNGLVTMEWLKGMKSFFNKHIDSTDIDFTLGGGQKVKTFIDSKLTQLTANTPKTRKQHTNSATKATTSADNLSGSHGEKQSSSLSMSKSLMSGVMPKLNSSTEKEIKGKTFIVTESQLNILFENNFSIKNGVTENNLKQLLIKQINFYKQTENKQPKEINEGLCEDVAYDVVEELGGETSTFLIMDDGWFWDMDPISKYKTGSGEYWNVKNLKKYGKPYLSWEDLSKFDLCGHSWIYLNSKHYDVECLDGVSNFWDLPIFKRWVLNPHK